LASSGDVTGQTGEQTKLLAQPAKMAEEDTATQKIRKQLAKKLKHGESIKSDSSDGVTGQTGEQTKLLIPKGKLGDYQWYEINLERLKAEKEAMAHFFPQFKLYKMDDGRYYWNGTLRPGVVPNGWAWEVAAIYNYDHPKPVMGGSVRVVLLKPDIDMVINALGWKPHHLLYNEKDGIYLCTTRAEDMSYKKPAETTAVQTLTWAVKWLTALELVMTGDLSKDLFNEPDGI
ncbi:MAG: hypothetical protein LBK97_06380, partial [Prevotellaceae bacterium]|nr:hypothetical protein [Prevotellaceae bacterium]